MIIFIRHGEDMTDLYNEVGGWTDRGLSPLGIKQSFELVDKIKNLSRKYGEIELIMTSPFARAKMMADIFGQELGIRVEENLYLKERNTYGLASGMSKDVLKNDFPNLYEMYESGGVMPGSERYIDFVLRLDSLLKKLFNLSGNILCVSHGHLMTVLLKEYFNQSYLKVTGGGGMVIDKTDKGWKLIEKWGMKANVYDKWV